MSTRVSLFPRLQVSNPVTVNLPMSWSWLTKNVPRSGYWTACCSWRRKQTLSKLQCRGSFSQIRCGNIQFWWLNWLAPVVSICTRLLQWSAILSSILPVISSLHEEVWKSTLSVFWPVGFLSGSFAVLCATGNLSALSPSWVSDFESVFGRSFLAVA